MPTDSDAHPPAHVVDPLLVGERLVRCVRPPLFALTVVRELRQHWPAQRWAGPYAHGGSQGGSPPESVEDRLAVNSGSAPHGMTRRRTSHREPDAHVLGLAAINRALNLIPKRAESRQAERLRDTFVDPGVAAALEAIDHQVLYGRRGTGKTHALRYL